MTSLGSDVVLPGQEPNNKPDYGPAVVDGVVRRTSPSGIQAHDECPRKWWFTYVAGIREPTTPQQAAGTALHSRIEHTILTGQDVLGPLERPAVEKGYIPPAGALVIVEYDFVLPTRAGFPVKGRIDLIDKRLGPARFSVVDWKTTSSIEKYGAKPSDLVDPQKKFGVQMLIYGAAVARLPDAPLELELAHVQFQTKGRPNVEKSAQVISVDNVVRRWEIVESRLPVLQETASKKRHEDVTGNEDACFSYGRRCLHFDTCHPNPTARLSQLIKKHVPKIEPETRTAAQEDSVALLSSKPAAPPAPAPTPSPEDVVQAAPPPPAPPPPATISVLPPDQPVPEKPKAAAELAPKVDARVVADIEAMHKAEADKARAATLLGQKPSPSAAKEVTAPVAPSAPGGEAKKRTRGRPPSSPSGMTEGELVPAPPALTPPQPQAVKPVPTPPTKVERAGFTVSSGVGSIRLYLNCIPIGVATKSLLPVVQEIQDRIIAAAVEGKHIEKAITDLRAVDTKPLGFGMWKAHLSELVRDLYAAGEFPAGDYVVTETSDERVKVVFDELGCRLPPGAVVRGVA